MWHGDRVQIDAEMHSLDTARGGGELGARAFTDKGTKKCGAREKGGTSHPLSTFYNSAVPMS